MLIIHDIDEVLKTWYLHIFVWRSFVFLFGVIDKIVSARDFTFVESIY